MTRRFGSRTNEPLPHNEDYEGTHPHPSEGHPEHGIPEYPEPLPGEHHYPIPEPAQEQRLDVPPAKPYYSGGVAHGVRSPIVHGGRPAPRHEDREYFRTEEQTADEHGPFKIEPIPVYLTEPAAGARSFSRSTFRQVSFQPGADPQVLIERNDTRVTAYVLNESAGSTGPGLRMKNAPTSEIGALLPSAQTTYREIPTQDMVYANVDPSGSGQQLISIIEVFKMAR